MTGRRCTDKRAYRTQLDARIAAVGVRKYDARAYFCPHCGRWHLTSQDKRTSEASS